MTDEQAIEKLRGICPEAGMRSLEKRHNFFGPGAGEGEQKSCVIYVSDLGEKCHFSASTWEEAFAALEKRLAETRETGG